jgi:RHS repeat-associated protein
VYRLSTVKDENHTVPNTTYGYDALNRLRTVTQTLATATGGTITTFYDYNVQDQLTSVTDPNGNVTSYELDDFGRLSRQISPVTGTTTYSYDAAGNLTSTTDANGASTTRTYDSSNRVTAATSTRTGTPTENVTWSYDAAAGYGRGRLTSVTDPSESAAYAYDRRGLLRQETKVIEGNTYVSGYAYDANGNRISITYPSGRMVSYTLDFADRPSTASSAGTLLVTGATYLPFGPMTQLSYGNGTVATRTYDNRYRILTNKLTQGGTTIAEYDYGYDSAGNITSIADVVDATFNRAFGYDDINRLITANSGTSLWGTGSYSYDAMGNMKTLQLGQRSAAFTYSSTTPKIASVTDTGTVSSVSYDAAGNELTTGPSSYTYSPRNTLASAAGFTYTYDARGVRTISTTVGTALSISAVSSSPATIGGGDPMTGTITMSGPAPTGGATVALTSDDQRVVQVPASVFVPADSTTATFTVNTLRPTADSVVANIRAFHQGSTATTAVTILRLPRVTGLSMNPTGVVGGNSSTGTVTIDIAVSGDTTVALSSANPTVASTPASVVVPAGSTSAAFSISTFAVAADTPVTLTASYRGSSPATMTVMAVPLTLSSLTVSPSNVIGGRMNATGTLTLSAAAPVGGATVTLSSSNTTVATVPTTITVAAGASTATFTITTATAGAATPATITGTYGTTRTAVLTVSSCSTWTADAPTAGTENVWFDDALPSGSVTVGTWIWDTAQKASGTQSFTSAISTGIQEWYFYGATSGMRAVTGDLMTTWVLLDPCNPPREIVVQWNAGGWTHRAYWGPNLTNCGGEYAGCHSMGALPPAGQWVRLDVPASAVALERTTISGMAFDVYGGKAWFDRPGRIGCNTPIASPPASFPSTDVVWYDDAVPSGATLTGIWNWDTTQKVSGTQSNTEPVTDGSHQHYFTNATTGLSVGTGDKMVVYVLLNSCEPPSEIMLQWNVAGSWEHRAYWGPKLINCGGEYWACHSMGALPATGQWVRLEVPASQVALEGTTVSGITFTLYNGQAWWDRVGKSPAGSGAMKPPGPMIASMTPQSRWRKFIHRLRSDEDTSLGFSVTTKLTTATGPTRSYSFYTPELQLLSETALSDAVTPPIAYDNVWFGGQPLAQINATTGEVTYDFNDHLGAPLLQTSTAGAVLWRAEREPYGNRYLVRAGGDRHQPLGLPGQEVSEETRDLQYNIFRWYRAGWGRYTQGDPLGLMDDANVYSYGHENPLVFADPLGLMSRVCCKLIPGLAGFRHCYIDMYDKNGNRQTWGLHEEQELKGNIFNGAMRSIVGGTRGIVDPNNGFDWDYGDPGTTTCGMWSDDPCREADQCVLKAVNDYPKVTKYRNAPPFVNSNTFAGTIARKCNLMRPNVPKASTPGWSHAQPPPYR